MISLAVGVGLATGLLASALSDLASQQRMELRRLRDLAGTNFIEVRVTEGATAAGRPVRAVDWPRHTLLTSIHREGDLTMPSGDTELHPGDMVSVITDDQHIEEVRQLLTGQSRRRADERS